MTKHAKERIEQRYNKVFSKNDFKAIISLIKDGKSIPTGKISKSMSFHIVEYSNVPIKVLYKKGKHKSASKRNVPAKIITAYPLDVDEYNSILDKQLEREEGVLQWAIEILERRGYTITK